jgi:unsaturated rhamnogalacturonyl hydrolase
MPVNDTNTPLHLLEPEYPIPYGLPSRSSIAEKLGKVLAFLDGATPAGYVSGEDATRSVGTDGIDASTAFAPGEFRLTSYEWGVTYGGMLLAGDVLAEKDFVGYAASRLVMIADLSTYYLEKEISDIGESCPVKSVLKPRALDDAGSLCAAMIKARQAGLGLQLDPVIHNLAKYIREKEYRLADGTFARNRPYPNTVWLDDLFMSLPALALYAGFADSPEYLDEAVRQAELFSRRMFIKEKGIYMHGWVEGMKVHPRFCWARANGWAVMAMVEVLTVLPSSHPGYDQVLRQYQAHVTGLAALQSGRGFWHQLLDRNDSYLETSATAIITFAIARGINLGIIDPYAFGPVAVLGWNAVSTRVNDSGEVEGTCVGTGMGFDQAFYYHRPVSLRAAHGYGPVLLAGAEVLRMIEGNSFVMNEKSLQIAKKP